MIKSRFHGHPRETELSARFCTDPDLNKGSVIPFMDDFPKEHTTVVEVVDASLRFTMNDGPTMAHVMHKAGLFKSISDARKNGWNRPIEQGKWVVGKKRVTVIVE